MKQCARCGVHIKNETNKIRCDKCMEKVMDELEGRANRPFEYYFRFNLKRIRHERNTNGYDS